MLAKRFEYDAKPIIKLNPLQGQAKASITQKIENGHYQLESVSCAVCEGSNFAELSQKDRYGLPVKVVICKNCGFLQTNPRLSEESLNEFHKTEHTPLILGRAKFTQELFLDQYYHGQKIYKYLKDFLTKDPKEAAVLEIGCGAGGILAYFRDQGFKAAGVDLDQDCIEFGRTHYNLNLYGGRLGESKINIQPDIVILSHVLEHLVLPETELSLIRSMISPDGLLYIEVPGAKHMVFIHNDFDFLKFLSIAHTCHFSLTSLRNLLGKYGFTLVKGNETIKSVFKPSEKILSFKNDYPEMLLYLKRIEFWKRYLFITPYKITHALDLMGCWVLEKLKLYNFTRTIYRKIINRTGPKS